MLAVINISFDTMFFLLISGLFFMLSLAFFKIKKKEFPYKSRC